MQQQPALPTETCAGFVRWAMVEAQQFQQIGSSCEGQVANICFSPFQEGVESAKQKPCRKFEGPSPAAHSNQRPWCSHVEGGRSNPDPCASSRTSELN